MTDVHPIATGGYGRSADSYVRGRPDYPPAALDWLRSDLGLGPGQTALELGSGTGKFTRLLVETGADIAAVEPVAAMLDELRRSCRPSPLCKAPPNGFPRRTPAPTP